MEDRLENNYKGFNQICGQITKACNGQVKMRSEKQSMWQKRYRESKQVKSQGLAQEVDKLSQQLLDYNDVNRQLKYDIEEDKQILKQVQMREERSQSQTEVQNQFNLKKDLCNEKENDGYLHLSFETPSKEIVSGRSLKELTLERCLKYYKEFFFLFQRLLIQYPQCEETTYAQLKHFTENFDIFMICLQFDHPSIHNQLHFYNFETEKIEDIPRSAIMDRSKTLREVLQLTEEQIENNTVITRMRQHHVQFSLKQFEAQLRKIQTDYSQFQKKGFNDLQSQFKLQQSVMDYNKVWQDEMDALKRQRVGLLNKWLHPKQIAKAIVYEYPYVVQFYILKQYLYDNTENLLQGKS